MFPRILRASVPLLLAMGWFLAASAATPLEPEVRIARLHYEGGGDWYCDPSSLPNWLEEFGRRTGIPTARQEAVVTLDSEDLYRYPFLYVSGHGRILLADEELADLRRYLDAGGFLYADDNYGLDASFREMVARLYPDNPLVPVAADHPIYHTFYDLPGLPKIHKHDGEPAQGFGVWRNGRLVIFYTWSADIGDGLEDAAVHGNPPQVREAAIRMAVNIMMYALTHP
ncbi:hypothetical protein CSB20_10980 [bacterium DOLZORAL124_64_63]|nr:MAG: hypothetical protein CSB20_10980 [bacterium DOLZORAL124_64_63]